MSKRDCACVGWRSSLVVIEELGKGGGLGGSGFVTLPFSIAFRKTPSLASERLSKHLIFVGMKHEMQN